MDTLLIRERYKIIQVLEAGEDYAFAEAVDILDREKRACLLNIYEGPLLRACLPCFDRLDACPDFQGAFLEGESLVAVFRCRRGTPIDQVFYRGDSHDWRSRLEYAQKLLHQVLNMADFPAQVSCAALLSDNVLVDEKSRDLSLRFRVRPMEGMNQRELVYLACDQLYKILLPRFSTPLAQLDLLDLLEEGGCTTAVQLYALWREREPVLRAAYEDLEKKNFFRRWCTLAWGRVKRRLARRRRR